MDPVKYLPQKSFQPFVVTQGGDYRKAWFQSRLSELLGERRLSYKEIAAAAGVSKQYLFQVKEGSPPSDRLIKGLCDAYDFEPPQEPRGNPVLDVVKSPVDVGQSSSQGQDSRTAEQLDRLTRAVEEQGVLIRTLAELVLARMGKDTVKE